MFHFKRLGALTLALALAATALTGCGGGGNSSASSSASGSSSQGDSSAQVESIDLAQVTDPYLATSGLPGDTVVARIGDSDITAAEFLYWASYGTDLYLSQFGGYLTSVPWDTDLGGITMAEQMKESSLNAAAFYALLPVVAQQEGLSPAADIQAQLDQQLAEMADQVGSEELVTHVMWYQMLTPELYLQLNQRADLHMQLQDLYLGRGATAIPPTPRCWPMPRTSWGSTGPSTFCCPPLMQRPRSPWTRPPWRKKRPPPTICSPSCGRRRTPSPCSTS